MKKTFLIFIVLACFSCVMNAQERINFQRGKRARSVQNTTRLGDTNYYILKASKNQTMNVRLDSHNNNAEFELYAIRGELLVSKASQWQGKLPETNDYMIAVTSTKSIRYTLTVSIK